MGRYIAIRVFKLSRNNISFIGRSIFRTVCRLVILSSSVLILHFLQRRKSFLCLASCPLSYFNVTDANGATRQLAANISENDLHLFDFCYDGGPMMIPTKTLVPSRYTKWCTPVFGLGSGGDDPWHADCETVADMPEREVASLMGWVGAVATPARC